jgi:CheY-like chemotaxis protein
MTPLTILLAEDNVGDILLVQQALEEHRSPHNLHVVRDGAQALAFVDRLGAPDGGICPDIVLLDLNLPKVDGPVVLAELRKQPQCAHTPVIVITSSDAPRDRERMAQFGIARYFKKPSDLDAFMELGAIVRGIVDGKPGP